MSSQNHIQSYLIIDLETVTQTQSYMELPERVRDCWDKKSNSLKKWMDSEGGPEELYSERGAIFAEFGKICCISVGFVTFDGSNEATFKVKSYYGDNEVQILKDFAILLEKSPKRVLVAHNGKEFDFPYLCRRYIINRLPLPSILDVRGKKPWEVPFEDTMEMWKFGDRKSFTSLDLLTAVLDIPSPKDDIDGSMVGHVYWEEKNYEKIKIYCEKDVFATAQVILRFNGMPLIPEQNFISVN